jgi:hypothetical protein
MNFAKNWVPVIIALIPQIIFENYPYILLSTIGIGFISGWFVTEKKVFLKILILQLLFFIFLFYSSNKNIQYLNEVIQNLGLPAFLIDFVFIAFNTLNITILFYFGYRLQRLIFNKYY